MDVSQCSPKDLFDSFVENAQQCFYGGRMEVLEVLIKGRGYEIKREDEDMPEFTLRLGGKYDVKRIRFSLLRLDGTPIIHANPIIVAIPTAHSGISLNAYDLLPELLIDETLTNL